MNDSGGIKLRKFVRRWRRWEDARVKEAERLLREAYGREGRLPLGEGAVAPAADAMPQDPGVRD